MARSSWRYLLFDLDNTLYPEQTGLLARIDQRINDYLAFRLGLEDAAINQLRQDYWRKYGTTLRGVKENHGIDPVEYIAYTYDLDLGEFLRTDGELQAMLHRLPWPKAVFSNSPESYAARVLAVLGVAEEFSRIFGIDFSGHLGKPDPETYRMVLAELDLPGEACVMIDDFAVNLIPARELGMATVFIGPDAPEWVDYRLGSILELEKALLAPGGTDISEGGARMARLELWQCTVCGYVYDPARGDPEAGIKPQAPFTQLPPDWACPDCGAGLPDFAPYT